MPDQVIDGNVTPSPAPAPAPRNPGSITINIQTLLMGVLLMGVIGLGGYIYVDKKNPSPAPTPNVVTPVDPDSLRTRVGPYEAKELAVVFHDLAFFLKQDSKNVENPEALAIKTVGDFRRLYYYSIANFQNTTNITGIQGINEPIKRKLLVAIGPAPDTDDIDSPATRLRDSLIAQLKNISEDFDPELRKYDLDTYIPSKVQYSVNYAGS